MVKPRRQFKPEETRGRSSKGRTIETGRLDAASTTARVENTIAVQDAASPSRPSVKFTALTMDTYVNAHSAEYSHFGRHRTTDGRTERLMCACGKSM